MEPLLAMVDEAYRQSDEDRTLNERALELTSQELQDRNERLRAFFDSAPFLMGMARVTEGDILLVSGNTAAQGVLGVPLRRGTPLEQTSLPPAVRETWRERADAAMESQTSVSFEYRVGADDDERAYRATFSRVRSAVHHDLFCYVVEDVTEHRRFFEQLVLQDRRASVGTLAAGVAHEINNPLTYVLSNIVVATEDLARLAEDGLDDGEDLQQTLTSALEGLRDASSGAIRVRSIVRDLRTFAATDDGNIVRPVDLTTAIEFAAKMAGVEVRKKARFHLDLRASPTVVGDDTRLGQVFLNLLLNAAEATPPGDVAAHEIRVVVDVDAEGMAVVDVSDTGCGIRPEVAARIFDPFFTTRAHSGGTGLGLAVSTGIVRAMGGDLSLLRTAPGQGSVFRVRLRQAVLTDAPHPSVPPPVARRGRLLVVDDDAHVGAAIRRVLSRDHDVVSAPGVRAAIDRLRDDQAFDLMLCDLRMPAGGGVAMLRAVQSLAPALTRRFVVVTGDPAAPELLEIRDELAHPVVPKPFDPKALRELVRDAIAGTSPRRPSVAPP